VLAQRGVAGFKLRRYRIVRDGPNAVRERWDDAYPPTTQIVRVGAGEPSREKPTVADDLHPEYLADELLVTTQGPDERDQSEEQSPGGGPHEEMLESREPGRFGKAGWTEQAGMPFWKSRDAKPAEKSAVPPKKRGPA
jgi:hypothetical protein